MPNKTERQADLALIENAAREAGAIAKSYFGNNPQSWTKAGNSPVSEADLEVDKYLAKTLLEARPDYGWLSEETEDDLKRLQKRRVFIVDPIDGTQAFLNVQSEWCVSIGLVEDGRPYAGAIYCPVRDEMFLASIGDGAYRNDRPITVSEAQFAEHAVVCGPDRLLQSRAARIANLKFAPRIRSLAYRFAMVADGRLDAAMARARASDWDVAAVDLLLHESGGRLADARGNELLYNKTTVKHPELVASSRKLFKRLQSIFCED
ncbi:3'(2'),5'-bisphosphate nucleotidase CysQ [Polycladidibacter hongkongensis]|uniref:3'(2'),5'-bisphosphate nucleotidase CysQ n=1 Tax=Polycladidibacter hongkongensis TaxID=1647556 RepID=UPI00155DE4FF|nr:3'(2'),5'-bisphosphate nucleotidase CysQ [Pseudovibrio hongkongensis]